jgi:hypothetical protein
LRARPPNQCSWVVSSLISPRGDKSLHWDEPDASGVEHTLFLVDRTTNRVIEVLSFERSISIEWAPSGQAFSVTDHAGSDSSACLVFVLRDGDNPAKYDLSERLEQSGLVPARVWTNHHLYCEVLTWRDAEVLSLRLWGYGDADPKGFDRRYDYSLKTGFKPTASRRLSATSLEHH